MALQGVVDVKHIGLLFCWVAVPHCETDIADVALRQTRLSNIVSVFLSWSSVSSKQCNICLHSLHNSDLRVST